MVDDPGLQPLVELALADLTSRLGVERNAVTVTSARLVTWPDRGFLGPAFMRQITEVPVDGSEILLEVSGRTFSYRTGGPVYVPTLHQLFDAG
jgi:hypothetical protein